MNFFEFSWEIAHFVFSVWSSREWSLKMLFHVKFSESIQEISMQKKTPHQISWLVRIVECECNELENLIGFDEGEKNHDVQVFNDNAAIQFWNVESFHSVATGIKKKKKVLLHMQHVWSSTCIVVQDAKKQLNSEATTRNDIWRICNTWVVDEKMLQLNIHIQMVASSFSRACLC